jgi:hypothetical protein
VAAHQRAGQQHWRWYVIWEPLIKVLWLPALLGAVGVLLWTHVPHRVLGFSAGVVAAVLLAVVVAVVARSARTGIRSTTGSNGPAVLFGVILISAGLFAAMFMLAFR